MQVLKHVSPDELKALQKSDRVALVLMGGGAKGAYQLGVFTALWKLGIRKFCTIAGTSVGALNALIFASGDPVFSKRIWDRVIANGVLETGRSLFAGVIAILLSHLLIFLSLALELALVAAASIGLLYRDWVQAHGRPMPPDAVHYFAVIGILILYFWLHARMDSSFLQRVAAGGYALALFVGRPSRIKNLADRAMLFGATATLIGVLGSQWPTHYHSAGWFWLLPIVFVGLVALRHQGLRLLHSAVRNRPLFQRKALDEEIAALTKEGSLFQNCTGPVVATLTRHAAYDDPYAVHPLDGRHRYDTIKEDYVKSLEYKGSWRSLVPRIAEWVPEYVDLRMSDDPAWALGASSAIPFAFQALSRTHKDSLGRDVVDVFVDGGAVDNLPLLPAFLARPEYIIVVGVNASDSLAEEEELLRTLRANYRKARFSKAANDDEADRLREEWMEALPPDYFKEREALSKVVARSKASFLSRLLPFAAASPGPLPPLPDIGPRLGDVKVIFIRPTEPTSIDLPILGLLTGTMKFSPAYKQRLSELGEADTATVFRGESG